jgi:hypothetical protein
MRRDRQRQAFAVSIVAALVAPQGARADDATTSPLFRKVQVGVELGYAFPVGDLERGSEVGDVVHGLVPLGVEVDYRFNRTVALVVQGAYAFGIPTLCATASDCMASLGHDIRLGIGGRFTLPRVGPLLPQVRATFGYEWFRSKLTDNDVTSGRSYRGPILMSVQASGNLGTEEKGIGLFVGLGAGIFSDRTLDTPAFSSSADVDAARVHAWLELGIRGAVSFY